ncbi:MAG: acetyl-CoA C-acyltransferase [Phycisphaerae bacterium]
MICLPEETRVAILGGVRTPLAKAGTTLRKVHVTDLARAAMQETLYRVGLKPDVLDEVLLGNVVMPADAANPARVAALWAGVPDRVPAMTVQRNCASGMEAVSQAAGLVRSGEAKAVLAGGAESMSGTPLLFPQFAAEPLVALARAKGLIRKAAAATHLRPSHFAPIASLECGLTDPTNGQIMGKTAETLAKEWGISREEQDGFALESNQKAVAAADKLGEEIVPVYAGDKYDAVTADNGPRPGQTMEALGKLRPIFDKRDGTVTVGNSCQVTDGAATLLVGDAAWARSEGIEPLGYVSAYAVAGLDPARMGLGPVYAIDRLLRKTSVQLSDIDLFEINEAFAAQVLACLKAMESDSFARQHLDRDHALGAIDRSKLNVNGGAVALGHPVGATGARIVLTLLMEMKRRGAKLGLAALCVGGGQGAAMLLERR